jgi:hypothetical protein
MESDHDLISLFEHDLFGKPVSTFPDHAPDCCFDASSSREPVSTSLERSGSEWPGVPGHFFLAQQAQDDPAAARGAVPGKKQRVTAVTQVSAG